MTPQEAVLCNMYDVLLEAEKVMRKVYREILQWAEANDLSYLNHSGLDILEEVVLDKFNEPSPSLNLTAIRYGDAVVEMPPMVEPEIDEFYIGPDDKTHISSNGTVICHDHQPKQHRDGKPPWCKTCGRTANNKIPTSKFQGHKKKRNR